MKLEPVTAARPASAWPFELVEDARGYTVHVRIADELQQVDVPTSAMYQFAVHADGTSMLLLPYRSRDVFEVSLATGAAKTLFSYEGNSAGVCYLGSAIVVLTTEKLFVARDNTIVMTLAGPHGGRFVHSICDHTGLLVSTDPSWKPRRRTLLLASDGDALYHAGHLDISIDEAWEREERIFAGAFQKPAVFELVGAREAIADALEAKTPPKLR